MYSRACRDTLSSDLTVGPSVARSRRLHFRQVDRRINKKSIHPFLRSRAPPSLFLLVFFAPSLIATIARSLSLSRSRSRHLLRRSRLLSFAFCFAPNLRPIIATEEAISNLNETPSCSRSPTPHDRQETPVLRFSRQGSQTEGAAEAPLYRSERARRPPRSYQSL